LFVGVASVVEETRKPLNRKFGNPFKALLAACLSLSSSLSGSYIRECGTMPMVPPCFAWISVNGLLIRLQ